MVNGNGRPRCGKGWSDFFYVPGRLATQYQALDEIAYSNKMYLEISGTTILRSLDLETNFEKLGGVYLPDLHLRPSSDSFWKTYNRILPHIHPFKMMSEDFDEARFNRTIVQFKNRLCGL